MYSGPFKLLDIVKKDGDNILEITDIIYKLKSKLRHRLEVEKKPVESASIEKCKKDNDTQFKLLNDCNETAERRLIRNKRSPKMKNLIKYYASTLDHYLNWYKDNQFDPPDTLSAMHNTKGIFSANSDFSKISIGNATYQLIESQSKIVQVLYKNVIEGVDGLTYTEIANRTGLTTYGKMSNYFQNEVKVRHLFKYSRRDGKYSLITN